MQVVVVYLQYISVKIHSKCASQPKIAKNSLKTPILGLKAVQGNRRWYPQKACQQCLLWCAASLCLSATVLLLDWATVAETARFEGGTQIWCTSMEDSLNLGCRTLHRWNLCLMWNISYSGCPGLSWMVSSQFTLKMSIAPRNHKKITKTPNFGGLRSLKVIDVGTTGKVMSSAASRCLSATVRTLDEPIVVKLRFLRGYPSLMPSL